MSVAVAESYWSDAYGYFKNACASPLLFSVPNENASLLALPGPDADIATGVYLPAPAPLPSASQQHDTIATQIFAPEHRFCGMKGDCDLLPPALIRAGTTIGRVLGGSSNNDVRFWCIRSKVTALSPGENDASCKIVYFAVAHILYTPRRIIVLPLDAYSFNLNKVLLSFRTDELGFAFALLYDYLNTLNLDWDACQLELACISDYLICRWDSIFFYESVVTGLHLSLRIGG